MFSWYILGQIMFFFFPYVLIQISNLDFRFCESKDKAALGLIILMVSNVLSFLVYKIIASKENKIKTNILIINVIIFFIYIFVFFSFVFSILSISEIGFSNINNNMAFRTYLSKLGPLVIILMFPIGVSTYYWLRIIEGERGFFVISKALLFSAMAIVVGLIRGQRTDLILIVLLPLLYLFNKKRKIKLLVISFIALILFSSVYAILFKINTKHLGLNIFDAILRIFVVDIDRNWTYWLALEHSGITTNGIMDIPYSGYLYTLLIFIPRKLCNFKGYFTETWFVFFMGNNIVYEWGVSSLADINWGITLSGLSEALINGGYIGVLLYSIVLGVILKKTENLIIKYRYLGCCIPFIAVLLSGYTFSNILIIYLPIIVTLFVLNKKELYKNTYVVDGGVD
jgi:hypothetical protein